MFKSRRPTLSFALLIILSYIFFYTFNTLQHFIIQKKAIDIVTDDLSTLAAQANAIDQDLSTFIGQLDTILQQYIEGKNIFLTDTDTIDQMRYYIANNHQQLNQRGFKKYNNLLSLLADLYRHRDEIYTLLGQHNNKNYLALLQNTGEKRPNGGFFGSFAFANIRHGFIQQLGVVDSYLPDYLAPDTTVTAPSRAHPILQEPIIRFVASNKFGFTNLDGEIITTLYETIFNQTYDKQKFATSDYSPLQETLINKKIDGILFLSTSMFEQSTPAITPLIQKWQFINANVDLIRGEDRSHKKEVYLSEVNNYFQENSSTLIINLIKNFSYAQQHNLINIYLPSASAPLQKLLQQHKLSTHYDSSNIYIRDTNHAFNKIDTFINKEITIQKNENHNTQNKKSKNSSTNLSLFNQDIIPISTLTPGSYTMHLRYHLHVPQSHNKTIRHREKQYGITMTERELGILGLGPTYDNLYRANQSTIHLPTSRIVRHIDGDIVKQQQINSPFSQIINLRSEMTSPTSSNTITIDFTIP